MSARARNFVFTLNNYELKPEVKALLDILPCKYMKYGKEIGAEGTPHLQGMVCFENQCLLKVAIKRLSGCHVEIMKSLEGSLAYVSKDGDTTERGVAPLTSKKKGEKEQIRWDLIRIAAEEGRFEDVPEEMRFKQIRLLEYHRDLASKKRLLEDTEEQMYWYYGPSGTGKSRKARSENPEAYLKMCNKWWDGYNDEDVVLIEDFDKRHDCLIAHIKWWADRYPFLAEYKGGARKIRPARIIVTSNFHPSEIWTDAEHDLNPILRRFKCIHFPSVHVFEPQPNFRFK